MDAAESGMTPTVVRIYADPYLVIEESKPMLAWLRQQVGFGLTYVPDQDWQDTKVMWSWWLDENNLQLVVEFRRSEDATLFKLRWS